MSLSHFCSCLAAAAVLLSCAASHADPNATASPPAPFLITLHVDNAPEKDYFDLDNSKSSFDVTIKNTTNLPQKVWGDRFPPGYDAIALHITAINGQVLSIPVGVGKGPRAWAANARYTVTVYPGKEIEQHLYLYDLPLLYSVPSSSDTQHHYYDSRLISGIRLPRLSGTNSSRFETITAYATFDTFGVFKLNTLTGNSYDAQHGVWSGQVTSAPITFKTGL